MEAALSLDGVTVAYHGDITVLNGITIHARAGEVTGIIGPNGAGKSTALKTMFGFLKPRAGRVLLGTRDITGLPSHQRAGAGVSVVPQNRSLFGDLSVEDNLILGCWSFKRDKPRVKRRLDAAYTRFPALADRRHAAASSLSGGQQRFVEIARALLIEPAIVLFDEPTAMLAPKISHEVYRLIRALADEGTAVVLVDQNVRRCAEVSDYMYILELGRNKAGGRRDEFAEGTSLRSMVASWMDYRID
jgi:branched-chain amino acid transport system ATP-binding protein